MKIFQRNANYSVRVLERAPVFCCGSHDALPSQDILEMTIFAKSSAIVDFITTSRISGLEFMQYAGVRLESAQDVVENPVAFHTIAPPVPCSTALRFDSAL